MQLKKGAVVKITKTNSPYCNTFGTYTGESFNRILSNGRTEERFRIQVNEIKSYHYTAYDFEVVKMTHDFETTQGVVCHPRLGSMTEAFKKNYFTTEDTMKLFKVTAVTQSEDKEWVTSEELVVAVDVDSAKMKSEYLQNIEANDADSTTIIVQEVIPQLKERKE